ncbi:hypothetical protein Ancab_034960, partial [Ancistrocladus abbreviatus]
MVKDGYEELNDDRYFFSGSQHDEKKITHGDPTGRIPHLSRSVYNWKIELYIIRK